MNKEKALEKHIYKLKYYKLMKRKIHKKIRCEIMAIQRITGDKHWGLKTKIL